MKKRDYITAACLLIVFLFFSMIVMLFREISAHTSPKDTIVNSAETASPNKDETLFPLQKPHLPTLSSPFPTEDPVSDHLMPGAPQYTHADPTHSPSDLLLCTKEDFFKNTLFIGDSRTVGLRDYANLTTAHFFCNSGLSSFSVFKKTLEMDGIGKTTLENLLTTQRYDKIYLMLGINELGYRFSSIVSQYSYIAGRIHELQPHARLVLCANLRVVADGKMLRDYVANDTINQLNNEIARLADQNSFYYIDVNPLFDDSTGALDPQYCTDDMHLQKQYYYEWGEWLWKQQTNIP